MPLPPALESEFELVEELPAGKVFHLYHVKNMAKGGADAVIRLLPENFASDQSIVNRFHEFFSRFNDIPNRRYIPSVYSVVGVPGKDVYVVEEYCPGVSLAQLVEKNRDSETFRRNVTEILARVCEALHHAHQKSIYHLCVLPADILIDEHDYSKVKLVGFGAQIFAEKGKIDYLSGESSPYVAPEVFKRGVFGPKADVYSLAVTIRELVPGFSEGSDLLDKALSVTLKDRFSSARQFAANIKELAPNELTAEPAPKVSTPAKSKGGLQPVVKIITEPAQAEVWCNGKILGVTTSSGFMLPWKPGTVLEIRKPGYESQTVDLSTSQGESAIKVVLLPAPLRLITNPWGASVKIDGSLIGVTVRDGLAIPRKRGQFLIEKVGFRTKRLNFDMVPTEPELIVELEMAVVNAPASHVPNRATAPANQKPETSQAATQKPNLLKIITEPWGAVIKVNAVIFGVTAYHDWVLVPWDKGEIVIEKSGFKTKRLSFDTPPTTQELLVKLESERGPVTAPSPQTPARTSYVEPESQRPDVSPQASSFESASRFLEPLPTLWNRFRSADLLSGYGVGILISVFVIGLLVLVTIRPSIDMQKQPQTTTRQSQPAITPKPHTATTSVDMDLIAAAGNGDDSRVRMLLAQGADPNATTINGHTAMMRAAGNGHYDVVKTLLNASADKNLKSGLGATASDFAKQYDHYNILSLLSQNAGGQTPTAPQSQPPIITPTKQFNSSLKDELFTACSGGDVQKVRNLLWSRADPNARSQWWGRTPLIIAIDNNQVQVVKVLLISGADPTLMDGDGRDALHWAKWRNNPEILELLRKH